MSKRIKVRFFPSTHYCITYCVQENININCIDLDLLGLYCGPYFYSTILVLYEQKKDLFSLIHTNILFHKWPLIPPVAQNPCFCYFCFSTFIILPCVVDLDSFRVVVHIDLMRIRITDPDPTLFLIADPDPVSITKNWKNLQLKLFIYFFDRKIAIDLSLGLPKGRPSDRRSLQPSKENIQHFKTWKFLTFSVFVGNFCPPGSGSRSSNSN